MALVDDVALIVVDVGDRKDFDREEDDDAGERRPLAHETCRTVRQLPSEDLLYNNHSPTKECGTPLAAEVL